MVSPGLFLTTPPSVLFALIAVAFLFWLQLKKKKKKPSFCTFGFYPSSVPTLLSSG